jgi:hypothetical protein
LKNRKNCSTAQAMDIDGKKRVETFDMRDRWMKQEMKEGLRYYYSSDAKWMFKLPPRRWEKKKEDMCACPGTGSSRFTQAHSLRILFLYFFPSVSREGLDFFLLLPVRNSAAAAGIISDVSISTPFSCHHQKSLFRDPAGIKKNRFFLG